ncbi:Na-translocating system protein MpsC family protein [Pullulanibacillus sp. KACC 23026]|uniref:Na-translocating system protein MpsC family protein n=1 Tax=Pullulanibacillus sp. KACC 23026 TaxID=3028315 RepID=UPI0023AF12BF|nr:Na-translocating system protein MpsC family protein [Pullulanibacillus sp. KACC 23026]WEG12875.1 Na-translocating system protein MpsC family protein [Pullulanibacillus sp. KACC 23026]
MNQDLLNKLSSYISKLLRSTFGRGPESCRCTINGKFMVTYINGFISAMEEVLINQGQDDQVKKARNAIMNHVLDEVKGYLESSIGIDIEFYYHDWNFPSNSGMIFFVFNQELKAEVIQSKVNLAELEKEVARISMLVQKVPDKINIHGISSSIYVVERRGILIPIEKALINKGFKDELIITKDSIEKSYFFRYGKFEDIFHKEVKDIFIDWDLKADKSIMSFVLKT